VKQLLNEVDLALASGRLTRNQLLMLLAALLSREAIVRALVDESAAPSSSSAQRESP